MCRTSQKILFAAALSFACAAPASAQSIKGDIGAGGGPAASSLPSEDTLSPFLIEPDAAIQGNLIKQQTYRSQAAGQNRNWNLDIGRFQTPIDEDPNKLADDLTEGNYSGMRFRLPFRGGTDN